MSQHEKHLEEEENSSCLFYIAVINNKKVLLRDRKRHTARCVASTRSAVLFQGWGTQVLTGWPQSHSGGILVLAKVTNWQGVPLTSLRTGVLPRKDLGPESRERSWDLGNPSGQTDWRRTTYALGKYCRLVDQWPLLFKHFCGVYEQNSIVNWYPCKWLDMVPHPGQAPRVPSCPDLAEVPPRKGHATSRSIMEWRWCTPQKRHGTSGSIMGWRYHISMLFFFHKYTYWYYKRL